MHGTTKEKISRKLFDIVKKHVPYRMKFKPNGVITPEAAFQKYQDQGAFYQLVHPRYRTELTIKKDFFAKVAPYTIYDEFEDLSADETLIHYESNYEILKIPNGRIYSNNINNISILTPDNKIVDRISYQYHISKKTSGSDNKILQQKYFIKPQHIDGTVFTMLAGYGATHNIAHWFFDAYPRLHLLKKSGLFDEVDYFLVPAFKFDYHRDSLSALGIKDSQIIEAKEDTHIIAKSLIASSHPRGDRSFLLPLWITEFLRESFLNNISNSDKGSPKRIFVSRKDSKLRQITNEDALVELLKKYDFETILLSKYPLADKVHLFNNADIIISSSGAGLTSLFFCNKNSTVVEIFPAGFVFTHYYNIAKHVGMQYFPLICKNDKPAKDMEEGQLEDMTVDLKEMQKILEEIFNQKNR